jgi:2-dehydro-3-deoxyphosphogluconate aldolase/(4S)-4-hydroxy-2-oxoglutarate aldolase
MVPAEAITEIRAARIVAVVRSATAADALEVAGALVDGGVRAIEITFTTPEAADVIETLAAQHAGRALVGAGTVTAPREARAAVAAGAGFLVSPGLHAGLVGELSGCGVAVIPGVLTPSEIMAAARLGIDTVKLFPASLGGPAYLESLRGPFPQIGFIPTGGVALDNLDAWLRAGAVALGAGGNLAPPRIEGEAHRERVVRTARAFVDALGNRRPAVAGTV